MNKIRRIRRHNRAYWLKKLDMIRWTIVALFPYFKFHIAKETKTNKIGCLFLFFLLLIEEIEIIYMKIIIIPPKNASVKINGIQGFEFSIHVITIVVEEKIRILITIIIGDMFIMVSIEVIIIVIIKEIQNLVYLKF